MTREPLIPILLLVAGLSASAVIVAAWPRPGDGYDRHRHGFIEADLPADAAETRWTALQTCVDSLQTCRDVNERLVVRLNQCRATRP